MSSPNSAVAIRDANALHSFTSAQVDLIKQTIAKGASDEELKLFLYQAHKTGLDPLAKQIYFQKRWNKRQNRSDITIITGIDGYRLVADRTGNYAGNDDPVFDNEESPRKATVTVYKIIGGIRCPFTASARWDQYYPGDEQGFMWRKMPHLMLGKCAEALALRKAFPAELSGLYVKEEMDQAGEVIEAEPSQAPPPAPAPVQKLPPPQTPVMYDKASKGQTNWLHGNLRNAQIDQKYWPKIAEKLHGRPLSVARAVADEVIKEDLAKVADDATTSYEPEYA